MLKSKKGCLKSTRFYLGSISTARLKPTKVLLHLAEVKEKSIYNFVIAAQFIFPHLIIWPITGQLRTHNWPIMHP